MIEIASFPRSGSYLLKAIIELTWGEECMISHRFPKETEEGPVVCLHRLQRDVVHSLLAQRTWWGLKPLCFSDLQGYYSEVPIKGLLVEPDPGVKLVEIQVDGNVDILLDAVQPFDWWVKFHKLTLEQAFDQFYGSWHDSGVLRISYTMLLNRPEEVMERMVELGFPKKPYIKYPNHKVGRFVLGEQFKFGKGVL